MSLESRSRMISFRLTDEEYERFRKMCMSRGLRNVSELVRAAVNQMTGGESENADQQISEINRRVDILESRLTDLAMTVDRMERRWSGDGQRTSGGLTHAANS